MQFIHSQFGRQDADTQIMLRCCCLFSIYSAVIVLIEFTSVKLKGLHNCSMLILNSDAKDFRVTSVYANH